MAIIRQGNEKPWKLAFDCLRLDRPDADFRRNYNYYDESVERCNVLSFDGRCNARRTTVEETWMELVVRERRFLSIQAIGFARLAGKMARRYRQSTMEAAKRSRPWVKKCLLSLMPLMLLLFD